MHFFSISHQLLLVRISEQGAARSNDEGSSGGTQVNRAIQQLAQKYCGDCKNSFDDLSKVIQVCVLCIDCLIYPNHVKMKSYDMPLSPWIHLFMRNSPLKSRSKASF